MGLCASGLTLRAAHAAPPVKAHLTCMSGDPVKSGKPATLTDELWCSIDIDSLGAYKVGDLVGALMVVPGPKSTLAQAPEGTSGALADTQDGVEYRLNDPYLVDKHFKKCEPFTINAALTDPSQAADAMVVWSATFKVNAACKKPKKLAASLECSYTAQDGSVIRWPGNGAKVKPRLEGTLGCTVEVRKPEPGVTYEVSLGIGGKGTPTRGALSRDEAGAGFFLATFEADVYESCSRFTVEGTVNGGGVALWAGKLSIEQDCPD